MVIKNTTQLASQAFVAFLVVILTACGDSATNDGNTPPTQNKTTEKSPVATSLPTSAIDLAQAYAPQAAASQTLPVCPWLSDASANNAVDNVMTSEPMVRRAVTHDECKWNVNMGFAFNIRATPLAEAADPNTIQYNMDTPPVLEPQKGPGDNAVAILDPTWNADNPRPFAFVFNADDRQFRITTTGVKTSIDRLRAVADEIVGALSNTNSATVAEKKEPTLDPCVYEGATIAALFGGTVSEALTQKPYQPGSSCKYSGIVGETGIELTVTFSGDPLSPPNETDPDYTLIDNFSAEVYVKDMARTGGYGSTARAYQIARPSGQIRIDLLVGQKTFPEDIAALLVNNLIARTN
jgi:hypothetical protein